VLGIFIYSDETIDIDSIIHYIGIKSKKIVKICLKHDETIGNLGLLDLTHQYCMKTVVELCRKNMLGRSVHSNNRPIISQTFNFQKKHFWDSNICVEWLVKG
jgi:hypothetical protein